MLATLSLSILSGRDTLEPTPRFTGGPGAELVVAADTLLPEAVTYIRKDLPNTNYGSDNAPQVGGGGSARVLVRFDSAAVRQALGAGTLDSAWLEFTIKAGPNDWGPSGRTLDLHRLTRTWTEPGATWNCAVDSEPLNTAANCTSSSWDMTSNRNEIYFPTRTDRVTVVGGQIGVIRLNVTADVRGYVAGTFSNQGWVLRKTNESEGGESLVLERDQGSQPRLVLGVHTAMAVPAIPPDSVPEWIYHDSSYANNGLGFLKGVIGVRFRRETSPSERQTAIDLVGGTVIGGRRSVTGDGFYDVLIQDDGAGTQIRQAVQALAALPQVEEAFLHYRLDPSFARRSDGSGWAESTWTANRDLAIDSVTLAAIGDSVAAIRDSHGVYPPNFLQLLFTWSATQAERQAAVDLVRGEVVGGIRISPGGIYIIRLPKGATKDSLERAIASLRLLPQVRIASRVLLGDLAFPSAPRH